MLNEKSVLRSVEVLNESKTAQVLWVDQILRDGVLIAETNRRKAYAEQQKEEFLLEVDGAQNYLPALGWA